MPPRHRRLLIAHLPAGVRVGVVSFASEPVTLVTPTTDRAQLKAAIDGLTARDGTAMGDALMQVLDIAEKIQPPAPRDTGRVDGLRRFRRPERIEQGATRRDDPPVGMANSGRLR